MRNMNQSLKVKLKDDNININHKETGFKDVGSCEHGNEASVPIKGGTTWVTISFLSNILLL